MKIFKPSHLQNLIYDLIRSKRVRGNRNVRGSIKRQTALVTAGEVGVVRQNGARSLTAAATGQGRGQFYLQVNQERTQVSEQQVPGRRVLDRPAAECQNQGLAGGETADCGVFNVAKCRFTELGKIRTDRHASFGLDHVIDIEKLPP